MTFDRVLPDLIRLCEQDVSQSAIDKYCVIRDVRGRVRLAMQPAQGATPETEGLTAVLSDQLDGYFVPPILVTTASGEMHRLAKKLFEKVGAKWPAGWPTETRTVLGTGDGAIGAGTKWVGLECTIGKEAWLGDSLPSPPWPLVIRGTPPIVTFHSFKGGVGRSTLVAACAVSMAASSPPARVAVVDLDVEAPGIGTLLGAHTTRGVIDILVDHRATGKIDLEGASATASLSHGSEVNITVFPAGDVDEAYVQKLARLDFSSTEPGEENPVGAALRDLLLAMKPTFDVILLDSRAGLHDLAGMALHGLAHVDVMVLRGTDQHLVGLGPALRTLASRDTRLVLVETMLPGTDAELFEVRRERTRGLVYQALLDEYYVGEEDPPQPADRDVPHDLVTIRRKEWLDALDTFAGLGDKVVADEDLQMLTRRIRQEWLLEPEEDGEEEDEE